MSDEEGQDGDGESYHHRHKRLRRKRREQAQAVVRMEEEGAEEEDVMDTTATPPANHPLRHLVGKGVADRQRDKEDPCWSGTLSTLNTAKKERNESVDNKGVDLTKKYFHEMATAGDDEEDEVSHSQLSGPTPPDVVYIPNVPLTDEQRRRAMSEIKRHGEKGLPIPGTEMRIASVKLQGTDILVVNIPSKTKTTNRCAICTYSGCFRYVGTKMEPDTKCSTHKTLCAFAVIICNDRSNAEEEVLYHVILSFTYSSEESKERDWRKTLLAGCNIFRSAGDYAATRAQPPDWHYEAELFDEEEDAAEKFAVLQTVAMFRKLLPQNTNRPLNYLNINVVFAKGKRAVTLLIQELARYKIELKISGVLTTDQRQQVKETSFPFGSPAPPNTSAYQLCNDTTGIIYVLANCEMLYGGQAVDPGRLAKHKNVKSDTVYDYQQQTTPSLKDFDSNVLSSCPRNELEKHESRLHVALYLSYLFKIRNSFNPEKYRSATQPHLVTHPYLLNKRTNSEYFSRNAWIQINNFIKIQFGVQLSLNYFT